MNLHKQMVTMAVYRRIKSDNMVNCSHIIHFIFVSFDLIFNRLNTTNHRKSSSNNSNNSNEINSRDVRPTMTNFVKLREIGSKMDEWKLSSNKLTIEIAIKDESIHMQSADTSNAYAHC